MKSKPVTDNIDRTDLDKYRYPYHSNNAAYGLAVVMSLVVLLSLMIPTIGAELAASENGTNSNMNIPSKSADESGINSSSKSIVFYFVMTDERLLLLKGDWNEIISTVSQSDILSSNFRTINDGKTNIVNKLKSLMSFSQARLDSYIVTSLQPLPAAVSKEMMNEISNDNVITQFSSSTGITNLYVSLSDDSTVDSMSDIPARAFKVYQKFSEAHRTTTIGAINASLLESKSNNKNTRRINGAGKLIYDIALVPIIKAELSDLDDESINYLLNLSLPTRMLGYSRLLKYELVSSIEKTYPVTSSVSQAAQNADSISGSQIISADESIQIQDSSNISIARNSTSPDNLNQADNSANLTTNLYLEMNESYANHIDAQYKIYSINELQLIADIPSSGKYLWSQNITLSNTQNSTLHFMMNPWSIDEISKKFLDIVSNYSIYDGSALIVENSVSDVHIEPNSRIVLTIYYETPSIATEINCKAITIADKFQLADAIIIGGNAYLGERLGGLCSITAFPDHNSYSRSNAIIPIRHIIVQNNLPLFLNFTESDLSGTPAIEVGNGNVIVAISPDKDTINVILSNNDSAVSDLSIMQGSIEIAKPVSWLISYQKDSIKYSLNYLTAPIYKEISERHDSHQWIKIMKLESSFNGSYNNITIDEDIPNSVDMNVFPDLKYTFRNETQMSIVIENFSKAMTIAIKARLPDSEYQEYEAPKNPPNDISKINETEITVYQNTTANTTSQNNTTSSAINATEPKVVIIDQLVNPVPESKDESLGVEDPTVNQPIHVVNISSNISNNSITNQNITGKNPILSENNPYADSMPNLPGNLNLNSTELADENGVYLILDHNSSQFNVNRTNLTNLSHMASLLNGSTNITALNNVSNSTQYSLSEQNASSLAISHDEGLFNISTDAGVIELATLDEELNMHFVVANLSYGDVASVSIKLPQIIPEGMEVYLWKANGTLLVPYSLDESRQIITLQLQDGIADEDGLMDGKIVDPLKLYIPNFQPKIERLNSKRIKAGLSGKMLDIESTADIVDMNIVDPANIPSIPETVDRFTHKMIKFAVENLTDGKADIILHADAMPSHPKLWKFNSKTLEWYEFPFVRLEDGSVKLTLTDGMLGDDDGLVDGVIHDDLGITNMWWNDSWPWRTAFNVSNYGGNMTNFQVNITLNSSNFNFSLANGSLSDLRFTFYNSSSDSETLISHWMETGQSLDYSSGSYQAILWFKVPYLRNNTNSTFFVYYGNQNASSSGNASAVFDFYDDFSTNLNKWNVSDSDIGINNSYVNISGGITSGNYGWASLNSNKTYYGFNNGTLEGSIYLGTDAIAEISFRGNASNNSGYKARIDARTGEGLSFLTPPYSGWNFVTGCTQSGIAPSTNTWYNFTLIINGSTFTLIMAGQTKVCTNTAYNMTGEISFQNHYGAFAAYDNVKVRKYALRTPTSVIASYPDNTEYQANLNITIDLPTQSSIQLRTTLFEMNGTVNCSRSTCGNVSAYFQYFAEATPDQAFSESDATAFNSSNSTTNVSVSEIITLQSNNSGLPWWNTSWIYRIPFNINISTMNQSNFQVRLNLTNLTVGPNFNWSDVNITRFVIYNASTLNYTILPYYVLNWNSTAQNATIYVKVPFLQYGVNTTVYLYYGGMGLSSNSSPGAVFDFYSDGSSLNDWTIVGSTVTASNGQPQPAFQSLGTQYAYINTSLTVNRTIELSAYIIPGSVALSNFYFLANGAGLGQMFRFEGRSGNSPGFATTASWASWNAPAGFSALSQGTWHSISINVNQTYANATVNGVSYGGIAYTNNGGYIAVHGDGGTVTGGLFDNIIIRKYVRLLPNITNGTEERLNFSTPGTYISSSLDFGSTDVLFNNISWTESLPINTSMIVSTRSSSDNSTWSSWFTESNGNAISAPYNRYLQYKLNMSTMDSNNSPYLDDITIGYQIQTNEWRNMDSSTTVFIASSPYDCGLLTNSTSCFPTLSVLPTSLGNYSLRLVSNNSNAILTAISTSRNISVFLQPLFQSFTASTNVIARTQSATLNALLVNEKSEAISGYFITFYDETGNGTRQFIANATTAADGTASVTYTPNLNHTLGYHTLNVSYAGNSTEYILNENLTTIILVSSLPDISNITVIPSSTGYGLSINISANVTDQVGLSTVIINITNSSGIMSSYPMTQSGSIFTYIFNDSWRPDSYTYTISANNSDGILVVSNIGTFSISADPYFMFITNKTNYKNNEVVTLKSPYTDATYSSWRYRNNISVISSNSLTNYSYLVTLNSSYFNFSLANSDGSDLRASYYNSSSGVDQPMPYWIESWNSTTQSARVWVRIPVLTASIESYIFLYYGNTSASSAANGSNVFLFFDDFDGSSLDSNKWNTTSPGSLTIANSTMRITAGTVYTRNHIGNSTNITVESKMRWISGTGAGYAGMMTVRTQDMYGSNNPGRSNVLYMTDSGGSANVNYWAGDNSGAGYDWTGTGFVRTSNIDYVMGILFNGSATKLYSDNSQVASFGTFNTELYLYLGYFTGNLAGATDIQDMNVSWMRARNITPVEPVMEINDIEYVKGGLVNNGTNNFTGYLRMVTQQWTGVAWQNIVPPVVDQYFVNVSAFNTLDINSIWLNAGGWNTMSYSPGYYRVYARLEDQNHQLLTDSSGNNIESGYNFSIVEPLLIVTNITHENLHSFGYSEYETDDSISWINVTFTTLNNTAYNAKVNLSIFDQTLAAVPWGPQNENKSCGDMAEGSTCENMWNNSGNGYLIPTNSTTGDYTFLWNINLDSDNGPVQSNYSSILIIHNIPSTFNTTLTTSRIYKPNQTRVNVSFRNQWSRNLTNATLSIICPAISGFNCTTINDSLSYIIIGNVTNGTSYNTSFNITVNNSVPVDDYLINFTLSYSNPSSDYKNWSSIGVFNLEIRFTGILAITDHYHPSTVTRDSVYPLMAFINNTGDTTASDAWLNYTLPSGWTNYSGNNSQHYTALISNETRWNNLTVSVGQTSDLGLNNIRLDSGAPDGRADFKIYSTTVFAYSILNLTTNSSIGNIGDNVLVTARVVYDNGTLLQGKNISFFDNNTGMQIGTALTDPDGYASVIYVLNSTLSLGYHTINASYNGTIGSYILGSFNITTLDVHRKPQFTSIILSPESSGLGQTINLTTVITDDDNLDTAIMQITYPNSSRLNTTMSYTPPNTFRSSFNSTWINGAYNISIFVNDSTGAMNLSNQSSFVISSNLSVSVVTLNNSYTPNQYVNLTAGTTRWWNTSWSYRQDVNISNISKNISDYQYMYRLNTTSLYNSGKIKTDCSDIRFAYYNPATSTYANLPFFNDTACNISGFNTTYWIKVPLTIPEIIIEVYYGNSNSSSNSSTKGSIFDFIDDFDGSSLDSAVWTATSPANVLVGNGKARINAGSIYTDNTIARSDNIVFESSIQWATGTGSDYSGMMVVDVQNMQGSNAGSNANILYMTDTGGSANVNYWAGDGTAASYNLGNGAVFTRTSLQEYIIGVAFNGSRMILLRDNATQRAIGTFNKSVYLYLGNFLGSGAGSNDIQDINVSWIRARKYHNSTLVYSTSTERSIGSAIYNSGSTNNSGYLLMMVQKNASNMWQDVQLIINDSNTGQIRNINSTALNLSSIWNDISWNTGVYTVGQYRAYAAFTDPIGNVLNNSNNEQLSGYWTFNLTGSPIQVNITAIRIFSVSETSEANWHIYTNNLIDSGLNDTFILDKNGIYRIEVDINNTGSTSWDVNSSNITYSNLNSSWPLNHSTHIWYSNLSTPGNRRSDSANLGGSFNGTIKWNTSKYNGTVITNNNVTFFFIVNVSAAEQRTMLFNANHLTFSQSDHSTYNILDLDSSIPILHNSIYGLNSSSILRGQNVYAYAQWAETILGSNVSYTTTANFTYVTDVNNSPGNAYNWTNFTITSSNLWFLGLHTVQIKAKDLSQNENITLPNINLTVNGIAQLSSGQLNSSTIAIDQISQLQCRVTESTNGNAAVMNYLVSFHNSTGLIGTALTNSTGWAVFNYTDGSAGQENLSCNITSNSTTFYIADSNNNLSFTLSTTESIAPYWSSMNGPSIANKGMPINLSVFWQDNFALSNASLSTNASGTMANVSNMTLSSTTSWANFSYIIPTSMSPGSLLWLQFGRDTSGNINQTSNQTIIIYGWSNISNETIMPASIQSTNYTKFTCWIIDGNTSIGIANYSANFSYKLSTDSDYTLLGTNISNSSGYAVYNFNLSATGIYDVRCNITTNSTLQYNATSDSFGLESLTVVAGSDTRPPVILGGNYTLNASQVNRSQCIMISGLWNESINSSTLTYDYAPGSSMTINISTPYTGNWTNHTLCTNNSWSPGNLSIRLQARDQSGNLNNTLSYLYFVLRARSSVSVVSPTGSMNRGVISHSCNVTDVDTAAAISNYSVTFYDTDLGFSLGTNTTNSSGVTSVTYNYSTNPVGPDDVSCNISSTAYYIAQSPLTVTKTINLLGTLISTIQQPVNNSILYRNQSVTLNATTFDENNNLPRDYLSNIFNLSVNWTNSSGNNIAYGNYTTWRIQNSYPLGPNMIYSTVNASYYNNVSNALNIIVHGYSNLSFVQPPSGNTYGSGINIGLVCKATDNFTSSGISNYIVYYYANNTLLGLNTTNSTGYSQFTFSTSILNEGANLMTCTIYNNASLYYNISNNRNASINVTVDTIGPNISYNPNSDNNGTYGRNWSLVNVSVIDNNVHTVILNWNGTNESFLNSSSTNYWSNKTNLSDGNYTFYAWVNDTGGSWNQTEIRMISIDTLSPNLTLFSPSNRSYNLTNVSLNYTVFDLNLASCWYNNGTANNTLPSCGNSTFNSLPEGVYVFTIYANDSVGHMSSIVMNFTIDRTLPFVNITLPSNTSFYNSTNNLPFNFTATDNRNISYCFYSLDYASNITLANCANTTLSGLSNQNHTLILYANDTAGNINQSYIWFVVNLSNIVITAIQPLNNSYITSVNYRANISVNKPVNACNITLDAGANTSMLNTSTQEWYFDMTTLSQTNHSVRYDCFDGINHSFSGLYNFTVDTQIPVITFVNPTLTNNSGTQNTWVFVNITINESSLNATLQLANSTSTINYTMIRNTSINFHINLTGLVEGTYNYTIFVNDTAGNIGTSMQSVIISFNAPVINIISPTNSTYNTSVVNLNATASKAISAWWFTLNNEQFNFTPAMNITMKLGINNLTVYGRDSNGLVGNSSLYFSMNGTNWTDDFHSFTGMENSSNINVSLNASIAGCFAIWKNTTYLPQNEVLSCWHSRTPINVTIAGNSRLLAYQARLNLNFSAFIGNSTLQPDCDDLRFSYINGSQESAIPHWIESCNSGSNATIWVKIPEINSSSSIFMYYNNPYASDNSNGSAVFDFFDDFSSMQTINWGSNAANWVSNTTVAYPSAAGAASQLTANYTTGNSFTTEIKASGNSTGGAAGYIRVGDGAATKNMYVYIEPLSTRIDIYNGSDNYVTIDSSISQRYTFKTNFSGNNYSLWTNFTREAKNLTAAGVGSIVSPVLYSYYIRGLYMDWFAIRKYSYMEPNVSGFGAEQNSTENASIKSILIAPSSISNFNMFYANTAIPSGTDITFEIFDANNNSLCGIIPSANATSGYSVCSAARAVQSVYLVANLIKTLINQTPILKTWTIDWSSGQTLSFSNFLPSNGTQYAHGSNVSINASISNSSAVSGIFANISNTEIGNFTIQLTAFNNSLYRVNLTNLTAVGAYSIVFYGNLSTGYTSSSAAQFFYVDVTTFKVLDIIDAQGLPINNSQAATTAPSGLKNVTANFTNSSLLQVMVFDYNSTATYVNELLVQNYTNDSNSFTTTFAVDPSRLNFTTMNITFTATGTHLFKCTNYSFQAAVCADKENYSQIATNLVVGQNYTITINSNDPSFGITVTGSNINVTDAYIRSGAAGSNFGGATFLRTGRNIASNVLRSVVWFNMSSIPAGSRIDNAYIELFFEAIPSGDNTGNRTHGLHRINYTRPWNELQVTWTNYTTANLWSTAGADFNTTEIVNVTFNNTNLTSFIRFNVTRDVQAMVDNSSSNFGWLIKDESEVANAWRVDYSSSESTNSSRIPRIIINYTSGDLFIYDMTLSNSNAIEGQNINITINVSNNATVNSGNFSVQLNASFWNGSTWLLNETMTSNYINLTGGESRNVTFNWTVKPGTYRLLAFIDYLDNVTESNESNNQISVNYTISAWQILYGLYNYSFALADASDRNYTTWGILIPDGNSYYSDADSIFTASNLMPLNGSNDLVELDIALNMTGFNDSIMRLYDRDSNGWSDFNASFNISGTVKINVPVLNSTNSSAFITGILWDSGDGGAQYDGTQDVVFVTKINSSKVGQYGNYDYEVRLPSKLERLKGSVDLVTRLDELI